MAKDHAGSAGTGATSLHLQVPVFCLVVLIGSTSAGKSTFARRHFLKTEIVSSDWARGRVADDENDQDATAEAFNLVAALTGLRLKRRRLTVIDATNVRAGDRRRWVDLAGLHRAPLVGIVIDPGEAVCLARNDARPDRPRGPDLVRRMRGALHDDLGGLRREGFRVVHHVDGLRPVQVTRGPRAADGRDLEGARPSSAPTDCA